MEHQPQIPNLESNKERRIKELSRLIEATNDLGTIDLLVLSEELRMDLESAQNNIRNGEESGSEEEYQKAQQIVLEKMSRLQMLVDGISRLDPRR